MPKIVVIIHVGKKQMKQSSQAYLIDLLNAVAFLFVKASLVGLIINYHRRNNCYVHFKSKIKSISSFRFNTKQVIRYM